MGSAALLDRDQGQAGPLASGWDVMVGENHIASLVVHCRPGRVASLEGVIAALAGAEVPASDAAGKLVVTLEADSEQVIARQLEEIGAMAGVLSATLVFHHVEPAVPAPEGATP
jgi:periplasmic nitrate reductase NapD